MKPQGKEHPDFLDYLERYEFFGESRPKLSPEEFDRLDDEWLALMALQAEGIGLPLEEESRLRELEVLLVLDEPF